MIPGYAAEACLKVVFNRYCLGGDINQMVRQQTGFLFQQREGDRFAVVYPEGRERVYVLSSKGRIYKVVRKYDPATLLKYHEVLDLLRRKYGTGTDRSYFPEYVHSDASRIGAIRRGDGRADHQWDPPGEPWALSLSWTRELGLALSYFAKELVAAQQSQQEEGY